MQNFRNVFEPIVRAYNHYLFDPYMGDITHFKGGTSVGSDWVSRHFQTTVHYAREKYGGLVRRWEEVNLGDLLQDNWFRLIVLNGLDRVSTIRQSYGALKNRFVKPNSTSYAFTEVTNGGLLFKGWLKGSLANVFHFSLVFYPSLYLANKVNVFDSKFVNFALFYNLFDILMFPFDRLKTLLYADTIGTYRQNFDAVRELGLGSWSQNSLGVFYKVLFNFPWLWTVYTTVSDSSTAHKVASWAALALSYPLLVCKTERQLFGSELSFAEKPPVGALSYRGVVPFLLANALAHVALYNLTTEGKKQKYLRRYEEKCEYFNQPIHVAWA